MRTLAILVTLVKWIGPAFTTAGYAIIAGAVFLERSVFLGLIVPGDVILALGGVYASRHELALPWVIVTGVVAALSGESIGYFLGRRYGVRLIRRLPFVNRIEPKLRNVEDHFARRGGFTVAIGRYATAAGTFIPFVAGMAKMPYARFLAFDIPSVAVWGAAITSVGYFFGRNLARVDRILARFGWVALGLLVVSFVVLRVRAHRAKAL